MHKPKHTTLVALLALALAGLLALPMRLTAAGTSVYLSPIMAGGSSCVNLPVPTGGPAATATSKNPKLCTPTPTNTATPTPTSTDTATPTDTSTPTPTATATAAAKGRLTRPNVDDGSRTAAGRIGSAAAYPGSIRWPTTGLAQSPSENVKLGRRN